MVPVAIGIHGAASVHGGDCAAARPANAHVSNILCVAWFDTYFGTNVDSGAGPHAC